MFPVAGASWRPGHGGDVLVSWAGEMESFLFLIFFWLMLGLILLLLAQPRELGSGLAPFWSGGSTSCVGSLVGGGGSSGLASKCLRPRARCWRKRAKRGRRDCGRLLFPSAICASVLAPSARGSTQVDDSPPVSPRCALGSLRDPPGDTGPRADPALLGEGARRAHAGSLIGW